MTLQHHTIIGLPRTGKTTFLAALWHVLDAGEVSTRLILDRLSRDNAYLNSIVDAWRRCQIVPRTSAAAEQEVTLHVRDTLTGKIGELHFPDLAGESVNQQVEQRSCTVGYVQRFDQDGGVMLFVTADKVQDDRTILDFATFEDDETLPAEYEGAEWTPRLIPQAVRVVELLQFLQRPPFAIRKRKLAVVVSAWDVVLDVSVTPDTWLARELPLLSQYLESNRESFDVRCYGVSAQGGDVEIARDALLDQVPSQRIKCVGHESSPHDLTAPIMWLMTEE